VHLEMSNEIAKFEAVIQHTISLVLEIVTASTNVTETS